MLNILKFIALSSMLLSCNLAMVPATAPTNPPKIKKSAFFEQSIVGIYGQQGAPKMFLWPTFKKNNSGEWVAMDLAEKSDVRQRISSLADEISGYADLKNKEIMRIENKYIALNLLESRYKNNKCYALCDEEDFFSCDITNVCSKYNETWKKPTDTLDEVLIKVCQDNESERRGIEEKKKADFDQFVLPLMRKEGQASLALLGIVERDYFQEITKFKFQYDPSSDGTKMEISLAYGDVEFKNVGQADNKIREMNLDLANGYLTFKIDAIDLEKENSVYGEIFFDLELNSKEDSLKVEGDIRVSYFSGAEERIGRFSSGGIVSANGESAKKCL